MNEPNELNRLINAVVDARELVQDATTRRVSAYQEWLEANQTFFDSESKAKSACQEAEVKLRKLALQFYSGTGEKAVAPGVGIRMMTRLNYEESKAMFWALEHKLALKLDNPAFDKMVKANPMSFDFVTITEEPQATIATELQKVE